MSVPTFDQFIHPLLRVLAAAPDGLKSSEAREQIAQIVGLTPAQRTEVLPSGRQLVYQNRIHWAQDRLKRAGLTESPIHGWWRLTSSGRDFLATHPQAIDEKTLRGIITVKPGSTASAKEVVAVAVDPSASPEDQIDEAVREINESLSAELLERVAKGTPEFFERLVLDVLHAMGYGGSRQDLEHVGGAGDGGIDGVISLDRLGLAKVYVQAKRWKSSVGRPEIQGFFGALAGKRAKKGVFITTSCFTKDARDYAWQVSDAIVLVDGEQLAGLMIEYGVGVTMQRTIRIGKVDGDYFEEA